MGYGTQIVKKASAGVSNVSGTTALNNHIKGTAKATNAAGKSMVANGIALNAANPMPTRPGFDSLLAGGKGSKTLLGGQLQASNPTDVTWNNAALGTAGNALVDKATATGPSAWLNLQNKSQDLQTQNNLNNVNQGQAGQTAGARASLASHGGLSSGAAERLAAGGAQSAALGQQGVYNQDAQNRLSAGIADEATKNNILGSAANLETQNNQFNTTGAANTDFGNQRNDMGTQQFNISNALGEAGAGRNYDMAGHLEDMTTYGANQTANAINNQPKPREKLFGIF